MNILEYLTTIPGLEDVRLGVQPPKPDGCVTLQEYAATPPEHYFGGLNAIHNIQARARDTTAAAAFARARAVAAVLGRYADLTISCIQSTPILDLGKDDANPPRHEYAVNFEIRRY